MQSVTNLAGAAMKIYDKIVHEQVFTKNVLFMNILKNVAHTTGSTTKYFSVHFGRKLIASIASKYCVPLQ